MACKNPNCPHHRVEPNGFNSFLFVLAEASLALDRVKAAGRAGDMAAQRKLESCAMSGMWAGWWNPAFPGLMRAIKEHPADWVPEYMRPAVDREVA